MELDTPGAPPANRIPNAKLSGKWLFVLAFFFIGALSMYSIYTFKLCGKPIRSDAIAYYLYLPATFMHHDLTLQTASNELFEGIPPPGTIPHKESNNFVIRYWCGLAILFSPLFFVAWLVAILGGFATNGFSEPFHVAFAMGGLIYATLGVLFLWKTLEKRFTQATVAIALTAIVWGTNLFHYATFDSIGSHAYSFFLFCAFLYLVTEVYEGAASRVNLSLIGVVAALIFLTRPTNALWFAFAPLYGICSLTDAKARIQTWLTHVKRSAFVIVPFIALVSIQVFYWRLATGSFLVDSYSDVGFNFLKPEILNVLFSVRTGLFFWSPVLLLAVPGFYYVFKNHRDYFLPILVFFPLNLYVISSWWCWWYASSFGHRPFAESMPMFAICLCALYEGVNKPATRKILLGVGGVFSLFTLWMMAKYWCWSLPWDRVTMDDILKNFFYLTLY